MPRQGCTTRDGTYVKAFTIHSMRRTIGFNTCSLALLKRTYYSLDTINMLGVASCPIFIVTVEHLHAFHTKLMTKAVVEAWEKHYI